VGPGGNLSGEGRGERISGPGEGGGFEESQKEWSVWGW